MIFCLDTSNRFYCLVVEIVSITYIVLISVNDTFTSKLDVETFQIAALVLETL